MSRRKPLPEPKIVITSIKAPTSRVMPVENTKTEPIVSPAAWTAMRPPGKFAGKNVGQGAADGGAIALAS